MPALPLFGVGGASRPGVRPGAGRCVSGDAAGDVLNGESRRAPDMSWAPIENDSVASDDAMKSIVASTLERDAR